MTEHPCIRCRQPVTLQDGHLRYCTHCGAPQIFLSEELQADLAEGSRAYYERDAEAAQGSVPEPLPPGRRWHPLDRVRQYTHAAAEQPWPLGIRTALLTAAVALALGAVSLLLPPVSLLMVLWVIVAPVLAVAFFHSRFRSSPAPGPGFAARLGLLTGVLVVCCCFLIFSLSMVLTRYVFHDAAALDAQLAQSFAQQRTVVLARMGADAQPTLDLFMQPEYRVGLLLSVVLTTSGIYLLLSSLAAALADGVFRRRRSI